MSDSQSRDSQKGSIIKEANELFWSQGFDRTSMRDISRACGFTQGNLYNYFSSKREILHAVISEEMKRLIVLIQPLENDVNGSPIEQLKTFILRHVEHTLGPPAGQLLHLDFEMRHLSPAEQADIIQMRDTYDRILRKIIRRGIGSGDFSKVDEKLFNFAIASVIIRARVWYSLEGELSLNDIADNIFRLFYYGLKPVEIDSLK